MNMTPNSQMIYTMTVLWKFMNMTLNSQMIYTMTALWMSDIQQSDDLHNNRAVNVWHSTVRWPTWLCCECSWIPTTFNSQIYTMKGGRDDAAPKCTQSSNFLLGFLGFLERLLALHRGQIGALRWICWWQERHAWNTGLSGQCQDTHVWNTGLSGQCQDRCV